MKIIRLGGSLPQRASGAGKKEREHPAVRDVEREIVALRESYEKGEIDEESYVELLHLIAGMVQAVTGPGSDGR